MPVIAARELTKVLRAPQKEPGAETVFKREQIPTDRHIRNLLDPVSPNELSDEFRFLLAQLAESGYLSQWYVLGKRLAISLDGVLLTLNLLAFLLHTMAQVADRVYQQVRWALGTRRTFFMMSNSSPFAGCAAGPAGLAAERTGGFLFHFS